MWIDGASGSLTADVASEGDSHPPARRFGEEGPREGRHLLRTRSSLSACRSHGTFHSRISGPASHRSCTQHQSHGRVLVSITTKTVSYSITTDHSETQLISKLPSPIKRAPADYLGKSAIAEDGKQIRLGGVRTEGGIAVVLCLKQNKALFVRQRRRGRTNGTRWR